MNSNTSMESPTTLMETPSTPSSSMQVDPVNTVSPSVIMMPQPIRYNTMTTGNSVSNPVLMPSVLRSSPKPETPFETTSSLKSNVTVRELLESLPAEPRILRVTMNDMEALCQVIQEFKEQCAL